MTIFTVFTPTFNRAHTIHRVYNSLCFQTLKDFEWVIVDDGSADETERLISSWKKIATFPIVYTWQENSGKHVAINKGVSMAKGEFFIIADSDDEFLPDALDVLYNVWNDIEDENKDKFTGVTGLCITEDNKIIGNSFPDDKLDSTPAEAYYRLGIRGDKAGFHRTEILKAFPFPELKGYKFYSESIIWNRIGKIFMTRYVNLPVRKVYRDAGNHLTENDPIARSKNRIFYSTILNDDIEYLFSSPIVLLKLAIQGGRFSLHQRDSFLEQLSRLCLIRTKVLWSFGYPIAMLIHFFDKMRAK